MFEFRLTKYDPTFRDSRGAYPRDDWASLSDVARSFGGVVLTREEYQRVEDAYVAVILSFLREAGVSSLVVEGLENHQGCSLAFREGSTLGPEQLDEVMRAVLREEFWCRLEGPNSFVHIGYDYYLYVGVPVPCPESQAFASRLGLFAEPFPSPYRGQRAQLPNG
jgi:hypothetical protein